MKGTGQTIHTLCVANIFVSRVLRFADFLPLHAARNSKAKVFAEYQSGSCQDGLKLQNTAMQLLSFTSLTNIKL